MPYKKADSGRYVRDTEGRITISRKETYRLWVEFLKRCDSPSVDYYKNWGDYQSVPFKAWWDENWVDLFAEPESGFVEPVGAKDQPKAGYLRIDVPIYQNVDESVKGMRLLLKEQRAGEGSLHSRAQCKVTDSAKINLRSLRNFLRAYDLKEEGLKRDEISTKMWAERLAMIERQRVTKRKPENYASKLIEFSPTNDIENVRRSVSRYIQKAKKIIANVVGGEFPGQY